MNTCDVEEGTTVAVFGLGAVGLAAIQAAKTRKASRIFAIDINESKFDIARKLGATDCINPKNSETPIQKVPPPPPPRPRQCAHEAGAYRSIFDVFIEGSVPCRVSHRGFCILSRFDGALIPGVQY